MNPVLDAYSSGGNGSTGQGLTCSHTLGNLGATGAIVVAVNSKYISDTPVYAGSVLFGTIPMTLVTRASISVERTTRTELWEIHGTQIPAAGAYTVTGTWPSNSQSRTMGAMSFYNIKNQGAEGSVAVSGNAVHPLWGTTTTLTNNALVVGVFGGQNDPSTGATWTGGTEIFEQAASPEQFHLSAAYVVAPIAGTNAMSVNFDTSGENLLMASFASLPVTVKMGLGKYW